MTPFIEYQGVTIGELMGKSHEEVLSAIEHAKLQVERRNAIWERANEVASEIFGKHITCEDE